MDKNKLEKSNQETRSNSRARMGQEDWATRRARETKASGTSTRRLDTRGPDIGVSELRSGLRGPGGPGAEGLGTCKPQD